MPSKLSAVARTAPARSANYELSNFNLFFFFFKKIKLCPGAIACRRKTRSSERRTERICIKNLQIKFLFLYSIWVKQKCIPCLELSTDPAQKCSHTSFPDLSSSSVYFSFESCFGTDLFATLHRLTPINVEGDGVREAPKNILKRNIHFPW